MPLPVHWPPPQQDNSNQADYETTHGTSDAVMEIPYGHDDASDAKAAFNQLWNDSLALYQPTAAVESEDLQRCAEPDDNEFLQVEMPSFSGGAVTYAYELALQNRIKNNMLRRHGEFDMTPYTPTFVHDCLMLPGSLANILGKIPVPEMVKRMTPALLPGFHAYVHSDTHQPCILQSPNQNDYVQGMLVFGQGKESRKLIHKHYRDHCRRVKVDVQVDVAVPIPVYEREFETERWQLKRRTIWAHAWLYSNAGSGDVHFRTQVPRWTLEDYLGGAYEPTGRVEDVQTAWPDALIDMDDEKEMQEEREVVYGGAGQIDYIVEDKFTGW